MKTRTIAKIVLRYPDGLTSQLELTEDEDGFWINTDDEIAPFCGECDCFEVDAGTEEKARKSFVLFAKDYERSEM